MSADKKQHFLKFTVGSLLSITAAVAVGLAVSLAPLPDMDLWEQDMRWVQGIMCSGVALLVSELVWQAILLIRQFRKSGAENGATLVIAISQRLVLATLLAGLLLLQLLFSRQVIAEIERIEYIPVYPELWPDLLLTIAILTAIRILLVPRREQKLSATKVFVTYSTIFVGLVGIAVFIVTEKYEEVAMTHFATNNIEMRGSIDMQRSGLFPSHTAEGFRSFWLSATAAIGVILAAGLLWLHATFEQPIVRNVANGLFVLLFSGAGFYVYWFVYCEFPRISPDVASVDSSRMWSDTVALSVLLTGLATTFGLQLSRTRLKSSVKPMKMPSTSVTGALAVYLIAVASGVEANVRLCQYAVSGTPRSVIGFFTWFLPDSRWTSWSNYIYTLGEAILQPEVLLATMLFVSALSLSWQTIRKPYTEPSLQPIAGKHVLCYTLASLALLVVAIPTLATFGFCYWLGPLVL